MNGVGTSGGKCPSPTGDFPAEVFGMPQLRGVDLGAVALLIQVGDLGVAEGWARHRRKLKDGISSKSESVWVGV